MTMRELIVDNFAGGGGASTGIEMALRRSPDYAINHDGAALAMHEANHPDTVYVSKNIWQVDPLELIGRRPVGLAWFSPTCTHFSKAKGGRPVKQNIRDQAWVVVMWAKRVRPRVIILENVEEFRSWGPLIEGENGYLPCKERAGQTFERWVGELRRLGYRVEWRELRACDYGAPTIRKRLFLIARRDGLPIVWPEPTHAKPGSAPGLLPWRTAADIIDWSLPCPSIFLTPAEARAAGVNRPLADATMARIAKGVQRYVLDAAKPFVVPGGAVHLSRQFGASIGSSADEPVGTVTAGWGGKTALVTAFIAQHNAGPRAPFGRAADDPLSTVTATGSQQAVVAAELAPEARDRAAQVRAFLMKFYGQGGQHQDCRDPLHTIPTRDRFGLVMVHGEPYQIVDIGMRMLTARELFRAQGFPDSYIIDPEHNGRPLTKAERVSMCGNSVSPPVAAALVRANYAEQSVSAPIRRRCESDLFGEAA